MLHLTTALEGLSAELLEDIATPQSKDPTAGSNYIEPSEAMIVEVLGMLANRVDYLTIQRAVKDKDGKKLSKKQVREIHERAKAHYFSTVLPAPELDEG